VSEPRQRRVERFSERARMLAARVLAIVAAIAIVLAVVAGYVRREIVDSGQFANRATAALKDDSVRSLIAEKITDDVVLKRSDDLISFRPAIQSVVSDVVGSQLFAGLFRRAANDVHRALLDRDRNTVTLTVGDVGTVLAAGLEVVRPSLAPRVKANPSVILLQRDVSGLAATTARVGREVPLLAELLLGLSVVLVALAVWLSPDRRETCIEIGIAVAVGGVLVVVAWHLGRSWAIGKVDGLQQRAAAAAVWDAFLSDLKVAAWILAGTGAVVAASAASLIRPVDLGEPLRRAATWITTEPPNRARRLLRGVALIGAGWFVLTDRDAVLQIAFTAIGVFLIYLGASIILRLVAKPGAASAADLIEEGGEELVQHARVFAAGALALALVVGVVIVFLGSGGTTTAAPPAIPPTCNGSVALCDRPLTDIALPATHNSMSVPLPGWYSSLQDRPIPAQLHDGIRGLLFDTHYADVLHNGLLRTDVGSERKLKLEAAHDGVSPSAVDAAFRLRDRLGFAGNGTRGMYLCHSFCELGGTPLGTVLGQIHDFLVANPGEVIVVVNQDYVTPKDFVGAVDRAGLQKMVFTPPSSGRWPTLRQMIDRNQRLVFMAENHAGAAPWYQLAYERLTEETPFGFAHPRQLTDPAALAASCRPNRGPASGAPLFLVNHWITTDPVGLPSNARKVNALRPLLARLRECQRIRHHIPNLVAVDFYRQGDLLKAVDALNGVSR
jgi:hypothetical protein